MDDSWGGTLFPVQWCRGKLRASHPAPLFGIQSQLPTISSSGKEEWVGGTVPLLATTRTGSPIIYGSLLVGWGFIPLHRDAVRFGQQERPWRIVGAIAYSLSKWWGGGGE